MTTSRNNDVTTGTVHTQTFIYLFIFYLTVQVYKQQFEHEILCLEQNATYKHKHTTMSMNKHFIS